MSVASAELLIPADVAALEASLRVPDSSSRGLIIFASAGDDRDLTATKFHIAAFLERRGFAVLHVNLLTPMEEAKDRHDGRFHLDIPFLTTRMCEVTRCVGLHPATRSLPIGVVAIGAATAAVLRCSALHPDRIRAVVSIEGRPDMAAEALARVRTRTLFLVAELDTHLVDLNRFAVARIPGASRLVVLKGLTSELHGRHALTRIASRAATWFANLGSPMHEAALHTETRP